jgi:hypothetical protein
MRRLQNQNVYKKRRHEMTTILEKPVSTSDLPKALTDFVHNSVQSMDKKKLRAWKHKSEQIMSEAKAKASARTSVQTDAGEKLPLRRLVR